MTTTHPQPASTLQRNDKIDWDEVENEKKLHSKPYDKKDEKSARDERSEH